MRADDPVLEFEDDLEEDSPASPAKGPRAAAPGAPPKPTLPRGTGSTPPRKGTPRRRPLVRRGGSKAPRREKPKVTVGVVGLDRPFEAEVDTDLRKACRDNHVNVFWGPWAQAFNCRGVATCGLCKIEVVEGAHNLTPRTAKEEKRLRGKPDAWRLACHATLTGDVRIDPFPRIPIDQQVSEEAIRRALMTEEERERLRESAMADRQRERERAKGEVPAQKEKKGLVARFKKKEGDGTGGRKRPAKKGPRGKDKAAKETRDRPDKDTTAEPAARPKEEAGPGAAKPARKGFGLKGRKS